MESNGKIKVLQVIEGFSLGGAEKKLLELADHFDQDRFHTTICSLGLGNEIASEFEKLKNTGIDVVRIPRRTRFDFTHVFKVANFMREQKIDVVMTTLNYADVIGLIAGRLAGVKAAFSWETISAPEWLYKRRLWPYLFAIKFCNRVISVSEATKTWLIEKRKVPAEKVEVIPYGVNLEEFNTHDNSNLREELGLGKDIPIVGMVGRLHPQKGHTYLIQAAKLITKKRANVQFVLIGDGKLRSKLESEAEENNLSKNFHFLGFRSDVSQLIQGFNIFVLPSLYEGLPNVVLEAMATAKPVVATPVDGTKEAVVDGETGLLVPQKDPAALAEALLKLIENPEKLQEMGQKGRKRVEEKFSLVKQVQRFEQLYHNHIK